MLPRATYLNMSGRYQSAPQLTASEGRSGLIKTTLERTALGLVAFRLLVVICFDPLASLMPGFDLGGLRFLADALVVSAGLALVLVRSPRWSKYGCIVLSLCVAILFLSAERTRITGLLTDLLVVFAVSFVEPRKLCRVYAFSSLLSIVLVVLLSLAGFVLMRDVIPNGRLVFGYGFGHPNTLGGLLFSSIGALTYVYWDDRNWWVSLVLSIASACFASLSLSSNSAAALLAVVSVVNCVGHTDLGRRMQDVLSIVSIPMLIVLPVAIGLVMLFVTADYNGFELLSNAVDKITHSRPYFANRYYSANGGFAIFGRPYAVSSTLHTGLHFAAVDCAYSYMSMVYGIAALLACYITYLFLVLRSRKAVIHPFAVVVLLLYSIYGAVEGTPLFLHLNFSLLLLVGLERTCVSASARSVSC